ncbi:MAG: isoleucine--tRNA ligase [Buchnera aphidicola (Ceratovacuna japonica)]
MKNYKKTLNLPKTKFSMKANLINKEPQILKKWKKINIQKIIKKNNINKKKFILQDGPPYANGNIHIGHALNKILKDIIIKSKNLSGFNTFYTPSWDCHGLPIEQKIEEKIKKNKKKICKYDLKRKCKKYVLKQISKQKKEFIRLGIFANWKNSYITMNLKNQKNVINKLKKIINKKYIYSAYKPIHWCIKCKSSLSDAEIKYNKEKCETIFVIFEIKETKKVSEIFNIKKNKKKIYAPIWTTTPWTLPSNQAISLNSNIYYNFIETEKFNIIIAEKITKLILKEFKISKYKILEKILGKKLEFINCSHPFIKKNVPIILSNHVNLKMGTGLVHISPDHGQEDFEASKKYNIKPLNLITKNGFYKKKIHKLLNKKFILDSNKIVVKILEKHNKIICKKNIIHKYPFCWRHNYPTIFLSRPQWFINLNKNNIKKKIIKEIKKVNWYPKWGKKKMIDMLTDRPDWCISRQRYWGVPITIFIEKKTNKMHRNTTNFIKKIYKSLYKLGNEYWDNVDKKKFLLKKERKFFFKSKDVLDVWFDSGSIDVNSVYKNLKKNSKADLYIEGSDQYRGWFMSSIIISVITKKISPYKNIIAHGFVVDKHGKKMSKSKGNVIKPSEIIKKFGADILRLWVSSTDYSKEIVISKNVINNIIDIYRKIRNTIRFMLSNLYDFKKKSEIIKYKNLLLIDKWIIGKTKTIQKKIIHCYEKYKFHKIINIITKFCSIELGSFYLDIVKDRLYTLPRKSLERKSCQTTLYKILNSIVIWISPILPFTADEIWEFTKSKDNSCIFTQNWFNKLKYFPKNEILSLSDWKTLILIKNKVNIKIEKLIRKKIIKNSLEAYLKIYVNKNIKKKIKILKKEIKFIFIASKVKIKKNKKNKSIKEIKICIKKYKGIKCNRCWNFFKKNKDIKFKYKNLCNRCIKNISENGEKRFFI